MKPLVATVLVRPEGANHSRPSPQRVQLAAERLRAQGLEVIHVGRFSVNVRANKPVIERVLGVEVGEESTLRAAAAPPQPQLAEVVSQVEIAAPAESF